MKMEVRFRGLESSEALREHALRRADVHLSRFGGEVTRVIFRISDINGPKGGVDKACQVTLRGPRLGSATVEELSADAYSAVDLALELSAATVGRELERVRTLRKRGPSLRRQA